VRMIRCEFCFRNRCDDVVPRKAEMQVLRVRSEAVVSEEWAELLWR